MRPEVAEMLQTLTIKEREELARELGRKQVRERPTERGGGEFSLREDLAWNAIKNAYKHHSIYFNPAMNKAVVSVGRARYAEYVVAVYLIMDEGLKPGTALKAIQQQVLLNCIILAHLTYLKNREKV